MVNPEMFKKNMYKTMKSISHGQSVQVYSQDDVTSLSLNPHLAQEMSHGIKQEAIVEELTCNQMTPDQAIAKLRNIKNDDNYDWRVHFPPK